MLTHQEEQRIRDALPSSFSFSWDGSTYMNSFETWWEDEGRDITDFPAMVLGWNSRGMRRQDDSPMNQVIQVNANPDDDTSVKSEIGDRVFDEMTVQTMVEDDLDQNGVPGKIRASAFANQIWRWFRFDFDQNFEGPNGERPVIVRVEESPSWIADPLGSVDSARYQMVVRLRYADTAEREVDAIDETETTATTDTNQ